MMMIQSIPMTTIPSSPVEMVDVDYVQTGELTPRNDSRRRRRLHRRRRPHHFQSSTNVTDITKQAMKSCTVCKDDSSTCGTETSDSSSLSSSSSTNGNHQKNYYGQTKKSKQDKRLSTRRQRKQIQRQQKQQQQDISLKEQAKYVALDCEMVGVGMDGQTSAVARVTVVGWDGSMLLDEFVQQTREVTDYRTFVSGIRPEHLKEHAKYTIDEVRTIVQELITDKILIGHALKNDLRVLGLTHPWYAIRDTARYEPFMQVRFNDGILWPRKLKDLVQENLHREIQRQGVPHSAYDDAKAAMDLYRSVRGKWEKVMDYKIQKTKEIERMKQ